MRQDAEMRSALASRDPGGGESGPGWYSLWRVVLGLVFLLFCAFPKVMVGLHTFVYRDYGVLGYPFVFHARHSLLQGELPLWNPLSNCGAPFLAQWGTMVLYPFSLVCVLFPLPWSLSYFCLGHLLLGALGMFVLARSWTGHGYAAAVAGVVYLFNGVTFSSLIWPNYTVALGWMPWVVYTAGRARGEGGRWVAIAALVSALQMLSGVPELVLLTWLAVGALAAPGLLRPHPARGIGWVRLGMVVLLTAGLTAAQVLPFLDLLIHSQREAGFSSGKWPMPGWGWANLLVPLFHCFETPQGPFFQYGQQFMSSYYLGLAPLVLALWAAWKIRRSRVWILAGLLVLSLILALGENGLVFVAFKRVFPLAGIARYPIKFVALAALVVPLLAAEALAVLASTRRAEAAGRSLLVSAGSALVGVGCILWVARVHPFPYDQWEATWRNGLGRAVFLVLVIGAVIGLGRVGEGWVRRGLQLVIVAVLFVDVLTHTAWQNPTLPVSIMRPGIWRENHGLVPPRHGEGRVFITPEAEGRLLSSGISDSWQDYLGKRLALWSNLNLLEQIPKINGSSTLQIREQSQVQKLMYEQGVTNGWPAGLVDFLGATYQSSPSNAVEWVPRTSHLPLITAGQKPVFATAEQTLAGLADAGFDPRLAVYLPLEAQGVGGATNPSQARVTEVACSAHRLGCRVETAEPVWVVVAQSHYHCWKAEVDGQAVQLWRANHGFQALLVPAGSHVVRLVYRDRWFQAGAVLSGLTILGGLFLLRATPLAPRSGT